jgi:ERCC4-type nuclease
MPKHECTVTIDSREGKLAPMIGACIGFEVKAMKCGDIAFTVDGELVAIGERKEVNDMVSSLLDGRYLLQRANLIEMRKKKPGLLVFYLFEGDIYRDIDWGRFSHLRPKALTSLWNENCMLYGLVNVFTSSLQGTLEWIATTQTHYIAHGSPERNVIASNPARHAKIHKSKETVDAKLSMLTAINGVTYDTAGMIFESYTTLDRLLRAFKQLSSEKERCLMLADILRSNEPKAHRIGPALSEKIYRALFSLPVPGKESPSERRAREVEANHGTSIEPDAKQRPVKKKRSTPSKRRVLRDESPKRKSSPMKPDVINVD